MRSTVLLFALLGLAQLHNSHSTAVFANAGSALEAAFEDTDFENFYEKVVKRDAVPCCRYKVCPTYLCTRRKRFVRRVPSPVT